MFKLFYSQVIIDTLNDEYIYCIDFGFQNVDISHSFISKINEGQYNIEFAKNCIFSQKIEETEININLINLVKDEKEAIHLIENFLTEYNKLTFDKLAEKYKLQLKYFNENIYYDGEEYYSD